MKRFFTFTKEELIALTIILMSIFLASFVNFRVALRRSRDYQRKDDVREISNALNKYNDDYGWFPDNLGILQDVIEPPYPPYLKTLPIDPQSAQGVSYSYISNGRRYQIYASLEGEDEAEFDPKIVKRNLNCGIRFCNFGLSFGQTPLDKSIEEYENEVIQVKN